MSDLRSRILAGEIVEAGRARLDLAGDRFGDRFAMSGPSGKHSLLVIATDNARLVAHWSTFAADPRNAAPAAVETIVEAFDQAKPAIAAEFCDAVRHIVGRLVATYTPEDLRRSKFRSNADAGKWRFVRDFVKYAGDRPSSGIDGIREERLAAQAAEYADHVVDRMKAKTIRKIGAIESAEVTRIDGARFALVGRRAGSTVSIRQDQVFKVSSTGKPFHQWPARIYVDGKFTPEAAFAKSIA